MAYTVLRSAAGSPVAPFVIRALHEIPDVRVVAVDIDPLSCGFPLADAHHVVPRVSEPQFLERMLDVCRKEGVDLLFPDLDEELPLLARARASFEAIRTRVLVSDLDSIETCLDKHATFRFLRELGVPTPETRLASELRGEPGWAWPRIVKPRSGRGSRGVYRVEDADQMAFFLRYVENALLQEFVPGVEYSVDTLSDLEGRFLYAAVRERIATDSGISIKGRAVRHAGIEELARRIVEELGLVGPACLQCIEVAPGEVRFIEINPRIAGSAVLSMRAGAPLVSDAVRLARGEAPEGMARFRSGWVMLRSWAELFLDPAAAAAAQRRNPHAG